MGDILVSELLSYDFVKEGCQEYSLRPIMTRGVYLTITSFLFYVSSPDLCGSLCLHDKRILLSISEMVVGVQPKCSPSFLSFF
jgi:hypothetical protein